MPLLMPTLQLLDSDAEKGARLFVQHEQRFGDLLLGFPDW